MKKLFVIDGTWMLRRNFHATNKSSRSVKNENDETVLVQDPNVVNISFIQSLLKLIREYDYSYKFVVVWDRGTYRYRPKSEFTEYKATREYDESYQVCWDANNIMVPLLRTIGIDSIQIGGLEADDLGMYYSHNSDECILHTSDRDWFLSVTPTTKILHTTDGLVGYSDIIKGHISDPFDLAIEKAIQGDGSDNIPPVNTGLSIEESINAWKSNSLPEDVMATLSRNLSLTRLDRILTDDEVHQMVEKQESLTRRGVTKLDLIANLAHLGNYPPYFLGVLGKYNSIWK